MVLPVKIRRTFRNNLYITDMVAMKKLSLVALIILINPYYCLGEDIYKWTSPDGVIHYSNIQKDAKARIATLPKISYGDFKLPTNISGNVQTKEPCTANNKSKKCLAQNAQTEKVAKAQKANKTATTVGGNIGALNRFLKKKRLNNNTKESGKSE